jgi:hypothetical protein
LELERQRGSWTRSIERKAEEEVEEAEVEEQFVRQARLRRWEDSGEKPPQTEV